jgi:uracil-DNA glycosylase
MLTRVVGGLARIQSNSKLLNMYWGREGRFLRKNLLRFLNSVTAWEPQFLFLGEAAGVHGARWTGVPFTDIFTLRFPPVVDGYSAFDENYCLAPCIEYEQSSCPLWRVMQVHGRIELLWNACPFVPHEPGDETRMRETRQNDIRPYDNLTEALISAFPSVRHVVGVGQMATAAARRILRKRVRDGEGDGLSLYEVQHPSRGTNKFIVEALDALGGTREVVSY